MDMERNFQQDKTYRYEVLNPETESRKVLYLMHGYGQLARYFIRKFDALKNDFLLVAPEGMHRFYLKGASGRVGASWMTKEAREYDISDNNSWLSSLHRNIKSEYEIEEQHILGFSQGGATAARWYESSGIPFNSLVLWACVYPPDLELSAPPNTGNNCHFTIGKSDEYYDAPAQLELLKFYRDNGYLCHHYQGNHDIQNETLMNIYRQIEQGKR